MVGPAGLAALALVCAACSTLPPAQYPPFDERCVIAEFVAPPDGRIRVPSSDGKLTIEDLLVVPPPAAEEFDRAGARWFCFEPGAAVEVRCRYRAYGRGDGAPPAPADVFVGARAVRDGALRP
jgi:hypothetical protein